MSFLIPEGNQKLEVFWLYILFVFRFVLYFQIQHISENFLFYTTGVTTIQNYIAQRPKVKNQTLLVYKKKEW